MDSNLVDTSTENLNQGVGTDEKAQILFNAK